MNKPRRTKIALAVAAVLIGIPAVMLVVLLNFDWNRAKPWVNARTSDLLGRPFVINGDLSLTWEKPTVVVGPSSGQDEGWRSKIPWPYLVAQDIQIGNPANIKVLMPAEMASIKRFAFSLNPLVLLEKQIAIPILHFESPVVSLLRGADGKNNWTFQKDDKPSPWQLKLQDIIITKGSIHLTDAIKHADLTADIDTLNADPVYGVTWRLHGKLNGETLSGYGKAGCAIAATPNRALPDHGQAKHGTNRDRSRGNAH